MYHHPEDRRGAAAQGLTAVTIALALALASAACMLVAARSAGDEDLARSRAASPGYGDVLDRLRASRCIALEREIIRIARESATAAVDGEGVRDRGPGGSAGQDRFDGILSAPAGAFVTLILEGKVRGCMGTVYPMEASLADEIASAARMAATSDPRRPPLTPEELPGLEFCVSVVGRVRRAPPGETLDPTREGVIIRSDEASGIILAGEARTSAYEISWAKREAGVSPGAHFELYVFESERFGKALPMRR